MLVVVAAGTGDAAAAAAQLRRQGATTVTEWAAGGGRVLVYGGPFPERGAVDVAAGLRVEGWPADVRPEGGGHLAAWQSHTRPIAIAGRLTVCFPWSEFTREDARTVVEIDPGRAFGTGAHPTTRLLLHELADRIQGGERVLDIGCGTGVLAIAAARLGAAEVSAIDIEQRAVTATNANAQRNRVQDKVRASTTSLRDLTGQFDVIVANIHAATLKDMAPSIQSHLGEHGWVGLSGLSPAQVSKVEAAYHELGVRETRQDEDWSAVVLRRIAIA